MVFTRGCTCESPASMLSGGGGRELCPHLCTLPRSSSQAALCAGWGQNWGKPSQGQAELSLWPPDSWCHSGKALGSQGWSPTYTPYQMKNVLSSVPLEPSKLFSLQFLAFLYSTVSQVITFLCWAGSLCFRCFFFIMHVQFQPLIIIFINDGSFFFPPFFLLTDTPVLVK